MKARTFPAPWMGRRLVLVAGSCLALLAAAPAVASASAVWVSHSPVKAPFNGCSSPGYNSLQTAIEVNAANTVIHLCAGTYSEQIVIEKAATVRGALGATIALPAAPAESTTACKEAPGEETVLEICGSGTVSISNVSVEGTWEPNVCKDNLNDIFVGGGAKLKLTGADVTKAGGDPQTDGCQGGIGIEVGDGSDTATATITGGEVSTYQKNGITVDGKGSSATIKGTRVVSEPTPALAQNGIQISDGAVGKMSEVEVSGNECNLAGSCGEEAAQSIAILLYEAGTSSTLANSEIEGNDLGVYNLSENETTKPQLAISNDIFKGNRYEGIVLDQGYATVNKDRILGPGSIGVLLLQYEGQAFGPKGKANGDEFEGLSKFAIEGSSDLQLGDQFGSFTITGSNISGNPGATVAGSVYTNNPSKLPIITNGSDS